MEYKKIPFKEAFDTFINLPFVLPPSVAGYLLLITFGKYGLVGYPLSFLGVEIMFSTVAIVIAQTFVALPFVVKSTRTAVAAVPKSLINAARTMNENNEYR
ncbi:ABC transporter permease subunit [Peptococcaceae bacterium]|nr:ABC transporter permease subunit [Peptococcaceae bacterium]